MAHPELIDALRREAAEKAVAVKEAAREEVGRYESQLAQDVAQLRTRLADEAATEASEIMRNATAEASAEARGIVLDARAALSERLYRMAREMLPRYREAEYEDAFDALVRELPRRDWPRVRVNPADSHLAGDRFPESEIVPDETIVAGVVVEEEGGRVRVDNSLGKRLERAWPQILSAIIKEIEEEPGDRHADL